MCLNRYPIDTLSIKRSRIEEEENRIEEEKKNVSSSKKLKRYYDGYEVREVQGKLWCVPADGGEWLEFAGKIKDIKLK